MKTIQKGFIFIGYGLMPALEVNYAEPAHGKACWPRDVIALVVRPPMRHGPVHALQQLPVDPAFVVEQKYAADSAHVEIALVPVLQAQRCELIQN